MKASPVSVHALLAADLKGIATAADLIRAGKLVVVPTETVYGIAVNLRSPAARSAARGLRGGAGGKAPPHWVIHVATPGDALAWAPGLSALGRRLVNKALPGPVAFELQLTGEDLAAARRRLGEAADETLLAIQGTGPKGPRSKEQTQDFYLTIRCPDFSATQQVLAAAAGRDGAVAIIGAGVAQRQAIFEASEFPEEFLTGEGHGPPPIAAVLDGGPARYRRSSTVVRVAGQNFSVIRAGVIDERIIARMADFQILFICSGNTCRSPMAAAMMSRVLADRLGIEPSELPLRHILVQSAGLHASRGLRATPEAVEAAASRKADLKAHISQPATSDILRRADVIYTMTGAHRQEILEFMPSAAEKTYRLDPDADVEDPIGGGLELYQRVADRLAELVKRRADELTL